MMLPFLRRPVMATPSAATTVLDRPADDRDEIATLMAERDQALRMAASANAYLRDLQVLVRRLTRTILKQRRVLRMSPDAATATCAEWAERCCELRAENERLQLELAAAQGRKVEPDWTGAFGRPA